MKRFTQTKGYVSSVEYDEETKSFFAKPYLEADVCASIIAPFIQIDAAPQDTALKANESNKPRQKKSFNKVRTINLGNVQITMRNKTRSRKLAVSAV